MADSLITAAELERMSPEERAHAVNDVSVRDLDQLSPGVSRGGPGNSVSAWCRASLS